MTFSERLKSLRAEKNMSQKEVAEHLGVGTSTVSMYEQGKREPDTEILKKMAELYGCSVDYLLGITNYINTDEVASLSQIAEQVVRLYNLLSTKEKENYRDVLNKINWGYRCALPERREKYMSIIKTVIYALTATFELPYFFCESKVEIEKLRHLFDCTIRIQNNATALFANTIQLENALASTFLPDNQREIGYKEIRDLILADKLDIDPSKISI